MEPADDVQLGDAYAESVSRFLHDFLHRELETVCIAFFASEGAKLSQTQDAVIPVVDVTIDDVAGAVAVLPLAHDFSHRTNCVQVFGLKQAQRIGFIDALARQPLWSGYRQVQICGVERSRRNLRMLPRAREKRTSEIVMATSSADCPVRRTAFCTCSRFFRLVKDGFGVSFKGRIIDFFAAIRGQTMHDHRARFGVL